MLRVNTYMTSILSNQGVLVHQWSNWLIMTNWVPDGMQHYWPDACCPLVSYITTWSVTDADRRWRQMHGEQNSTAPPTLCVGGPVIIQGKHYSNRYFNYMNKNRKKHGKRIGKSAIQDDVNKSDWQRKSVIRLQKTNDSEQPDMLQTK